MKNLKLLFVTLLIFVSITLCACQKEIIASLNIVYKEEMIVGEEILIEVTSSVDNDVISFENLNPDILEFDGSKAKALKEGFGEIVINSLYKTSETISIIVLEPQTPSEISMYIQEENLVTEVEYQLVIDVIPSNANKEFTLTYDSSALSIDNDTLKVTFFKAGKHMITCFNKKNKSINKTIIVDVDFNPEIEVYELLFVGNSLTKFQYDIPAMVVVMMQEKGLKVNSTLDGPEAQWLSDHKTSFEKYIENNKYTHVILQERSHGTVTDYNKFESTILEYSEKVKANGAKLVLYQTWAYNTGLNGMSKLEMYEAIKAAYNQAAIKTNAIVAKAGEAFVMFENEYIDGPSLYYDTHHPSVYGAFLSACVHYVTLTGKRASEVEYVYDGISEEYADGIKSIADKIVLGE